MRIRIINFKVLTLVVVLSLILTAAASARTEAARTSVLGLSSVEKMKPEGEYVVEVFKGDEWQEAGRLTFDKYYRDREVDLGKFISGADVSLKVRLTERGGGAAHIDSVSLGGMQPSEAKEFDAEAWHAQSLRKIAGKDHDVIDAFGKTLEFAFPLGKDMTLRLTARVEPEAISKTPFQFPLQNLYKQMNEQSRFYRYKMDSVKGSLKVDGKMDQVSAEEPFFKEFSRTGSGHPSGFTYGWVRNDAENLYVTMDFTADNTMDGGKDYAKVYVKTGTELKEFRVSVPETRWGLPDFTYTDKVPYEHKVYKFRIPFSELGITQTDRPRELQLAFAAYGTASPGAYAPALAYDPVNKRFLVVFERFDGLQYEIVGQLVNPDRSPFGPEFVISSAASIRHTPSVAYDSANERFLVAWADFRSGINYDIYGQFVRASDGALFNHTQPGDPYNPPGSAGANLVISNAAAWKMNSSVSYDSANQRFLVIWEDQRSGDFHIHGQFVRASDGALFNHTQPGDPYNPAGSTNANFVISNAAGSQASASTAYDGANQRFLVVWRDFRSGAADIYGQLVRASDGALFNHAQPGDPYNPAGSTNANFVISNATGSQSSVSAAYDGDNQRYLVAWSDNRGGTFDIYGQLVRASDGALFNHTQPGDPYNPSGSADANFVISNAAVNQYAPSIAYDNSDRRFLAVWEHNSATIYGQRINADGSLYGTASNVNFLIAADADSQVKPAAAFNPACGNFLTIFETNDGGVYDIGLKIVGPPCCAPPPSGMIAWWGGDNNALDLVGTNNGTLMNGAAYEAGKVGQAFSYNGVDQFVQTPDSPGLHISAVTLDAWINTADPSADQAIIAKALPLNGWASYLLMIRPGMGVYFEVDNSSSGRYGGWRTTAFLPQADTWYHITATWENLNGTSSDANIFVNGVEQAITMNANQGYDATFTIGYDSLPLNIGSLAGSSFFNGLMDEVEIFSRALSADEIEAIYDAGSTGKCRSCAAPPTNMISWWRAEDNAEDIVGGNNGTLQGGAMYAAGKVGQAFSFDGANDYVSISDADFRSNAARTMGFWVKTSDAGAPTTFGHLKGAFFGRGNSVDQHLHLGIAGGRQTLEWYESGHHSIQGTSNIADGNWHYLVFVSDGAGTASLYVDAVLENSGNFTHTSGTTSTRFGSQYEGNTSYNYFFNGLVDEVEFYSRAFSADEIARIYNAGCAGKCTFTIGTNSPSNGAIACDASAGQGYNATCTLTPDTGYYLSALTDNGGDVLGDVVAGIYTISGVAENHDIVATFARYPVWRDGTTGYFMTIGEAYGDGSTAYTIKAHGVELSDSSLNLSGTADVIMDCGYLPDYSGYSGILTTITGPLTISGNGTVTVSNIIVK